VDDYIAIIDEKEEAEATLLHGRNRKKKEGVLVLQQIGGKL
jgi:hypothetical protein